MTITLHHLNNSRSIRIIWLLEELEIDYEIKEYQRLSSGMAPPELKQLHPQGHSPVIEDKENGKIIPESGAIIEYLIDKFGNGKFKNDDDLFWKHYCEGTLMSFAVFKLVLNVSIAKIPWLLRPILGIVPRMILNMWVDPNLNSAVSVVEDQLKGRDGWFVGGDVDGNPTISDFMLSFTIDVLVHGGRVDNIGEGMKSYAKRLHSRPAYKRAIEKSGDDYKYK